MKPEAKNYTPAKAERIPLPIPAVCQVGRTINRGSPVACDEALVCERCHKCLHHCMCSGGLARPAEGPPVKRRKKGDDPNQLALCEKPNLHISYATQKGTLK